MSRAAPSLRLGVAGLGGMGTLHAENAQRIPGAELVAVAAARAGRAEEVAGRLGVRPCTYGELFAADDVEAVILAARSVDHGPLAVEVLEAGKHLFLEKPGATSLAEHDALRAASASRPGQVVQVGYMRRYDDAFVDTARRVAAEETGRPLVVLLTSRDTEWPSGENPRDTGGFLLDMASHDYDAACWLLDDEPVEVSVARQTLVYPELAGLGDLDNAVVTIRFARGGLAVTHVSRTSSYGHVIRCEVVGTDGSVFVRAGDEGEAVVGRGAAERFPADYRERFADAYVAELTAFVRACRGEGPAGPTLESGRRHGCCRARERRRRAAARGRHRLALAVTRRRLGARAGTVALALLAAAVIGAAVADSIRKSGHRRGTVRHAVGPRPEADVRLPGRTAIAARLEREGAGGVLYFVDPACRLRALRLPALEPAPAPRDGGCRALVSPSTAPPGWSLWPRDTPLAAYCRRGRVIVSGSVGESLPMIGGCAPAWRPDGSMTYVRRGAIVQFPRTGRARVVRSRDQLALALEGVSALRGTRGWRATNVAWLGPTRFAIVARRRGEAVLAVFAGRRILALTRVPRGVSELSASPRGMHLVLRVDGRLHAYRVARPGLRRVRSFGVPVAIAWSPDERWRAVATSDVLVLMRAGKSIALPLRALDLAWTRAPGPTK